MLQANSRAWMQVDLYAIEHNVEEIKKLLPSTTKIMAVVKANCYGHGDVEIAKILVKHEIDTFAVSSVDEAMNLRDVGIDGTILILGYTPPMHFHLLHENDLTQTVLSYEYGKKLNDFAKRKQTNIKVHIKVDTGMGRLGIRALEDDYHFDEISGVYQLKNIKVDGIFSHFSVSDSLDNADDLQYTDKQIVQFNKVLSDLKQAGINPMATHISNSYGVLNYPHLPYDFVRPGLILIGVTSNDQVAIKTKPDLIPAMSFLANISLVKKIKKGHHVSYGRNFTAESDRIVATVSCGYADGLPRLASNQHMYMLVHGQRAEIIGNICMDQCMIDVTHIKGVMEGDVVTIVGKDGNERITIDQWSRCVHSINNELLCMISARVPRLYTNKTSCL